MIIVRLKLLCYRGTHHVRRSRGVNTSYQCSRRLGHKIRRNGPPGRITRHGFRLCAWRGWCHGRSRYRFRSWLSRLAPWVSSARRADAAPTAQVDAPQPLWVYLIHHPIAHIRIQVDPFLKPNRVSGQKPTRRGVKVTVRQQQKPCLAVSVVTTGSCDRCPASSDLPSHKHTLGY